MYVWLSPFAVHLKLSKHCLLISYTSMQNKKFKNWKQKKGCPVPGAQSVSAAALRCADAPSLGPLPGSTTNNAFSPHPMDRKLRCKRSKKRSQEHTAREQLRRLQAEGPERPALPCPSQRQSALWRRRAPGDDIPWRLISLSKLCRPLPFRVQARRDWLKDKTKRVMCFRDPRILERPRQEHKA